MRLLALLFVSFTALGQEWPSKPVRIVVPFPPGGAVDAMPRIAADTVYRAEPDGYTLLVTPPAPLVINPFLSKLPYDPAQFVPVGVIGSIPSVMLVHPRSRRAMCASS